jgi:diacylglycerol kinase family enzyme
LPLPSVAILSNHLSTRNQGNDGWMDDIVADHAGVRRFIIDQIDDIGRILAECAAAGTQTLVVDGGDGTAGLVFSGLLNDGPYKTLPALALLPSGKTNMTAAAWSLSGDRREALAALLRNSAEGTLTAKVHSQPVLTLREGVAPPRHGAFFGAADMVDGILYCRKNIYPLGWPNSLSHGAAVGILLWRALIAGQEGGSIEVQGEDPAWGEDGRFYVVMATTMDKLLLGMRPEPSTGAGPVHYLSLRTGAQSVLSTLPNLVRQRFSASAKRTVRRTTSVSFAFSGSYTLDGELYDAKHGTPVIVDGTQRLSFIRW